MGFVMAGEGALSESLNSRPPWRICAHLVLPFIVVQVASHLAGIRFDASPLQWYWQYLDPSLLEKKLLGSLFYLHSQPPLFNLFLGVIAKVFPPEARDEAFAAIYYLAGYALYCTTFLLQRSLGVRSSIAVA